MKKNMKGGKLMKKVLIFLLLVFLMGCADQPENDMGNNAYELNAYLDTENDTLTVSGTLSYKNDDYDLDELYLTLYPNAVNPSSRDENVLFSSLSINGEETNYEIAGDDDTQIHINLKKTLKHQTRISIEFSYMFNYWSDDRIADYGNYYLTMFFYPFVAMYDDEGWNIDAYTFRGESYYNEIGDYDVTINVPADYLIAASGAIVSKIEEDGRQISRYQINDARDFSFAASSDYHLYEFETEEISYEIYSIRDISAFEQYTVQTTLENTFDFYENAIGDYPYDHFTLELGNYYGMESSGVIYCSSEISTETIIHECIHQWFYSMVGNDQSDESFLDEAMTTYMTSLYYYELYGLAGYNAMLDYRDSLQTRLVERYQVSLGDSMFRKVDEFGDLYAMEIYYHGPTMIRYYVDEFMDGDVERFYEIISTYFNTYKFEIATIDEWLDLLEEETGIDNTKEWFMMQMSEIQDLDNRP